MRTRDDHALLGFFKKSDDVIACHGWKTLQKVIDRVARFQAIDQRLGRNPRPGEYRRAAHDVW